MNNSDSSINYSRNYPVLRAGSYYYQILPTTGGTSLGYWYRNGAIPTSIFKVSTIFATSDNTIISSEPNYPLTTFSFPANVPIPIPEKFQIKLNYLNDTSSSLQNMSILCTNAKLTGTDTIYNPPGGAFYPDCIINYDTGSNNQPYTYDIGTDTLSLLNLTTTGKLTVDTIEPIEHTLSIGTEATTIHIGTGSSGTINIGGVGSVVNINGNINYVDTKNLEVDNLNILLNGNSEGTSRARGAGIYIRDAGDNRKGYLITNTFGTGYLLKAPESDNIIHIDNSAFTTNGFIKTTLTNGNSGLSGAVIEIMDVNNLQETINQILSRLEKAGL
jgi:hypothetical protein